MVRSLTVPVAGRSSLETTGNVRLGRSAGGLTGSLEGSLCRPDTVAGGLTMTSMLRSVVVFGKGVTGAD